MRAIGGITLCWLALLSSAHAAVISFNAVGGATSGGMALSETAGASAANASVTNWNNIYSNTSTPGNAITGSLAAGTIVNNTGATQIGMALSWNGTGLTSAGVGTGTGSQRMLESEWDLFDSGGVTSTVDMTFTLTNIPYSAYNVVYYVQDGSGGVNRGGDVTANGTTKSIRMYTNATDNPAGANGFTEANSNFTFNAATTDLGSYLVIPNVTGSTLTLTISSKNTTTPRIRFSGFQVVEAIPEPSTYVGIALVSMLFGTTWLRRRRAI